jgi:site-specific recombinase XerD
LATELLASGASLHEIADVLGHSCLATTRIYAAVDIRRLRDVSMPWPQAGEAS